MCHIKKKGGGVDLETLIPIEPYGENNQYRISLVLPKIEYLN